MAKQSKRRKKGAKPTAGKRRKKSTAPVLKWESGFWKRNWLPGLLLLLLPFVFYYATWDHGYVLDDQIVVTENDFTKKGFGGLWDILTTESMTGYFGEQKNLIQGGRYRPLSIMTFAVEYAFTAQEYTDNKGNTFMAPHPGISHYLNILFYAFCGLLIFRIFGGLLPLRKKQPWWLGVAFVTALVFVMHPVHVEAVANVKGRDEILTMLLSLGALYFSLRHLAQPKRWEWLAAMAGTFFLALLAKENAVTFLAVIPVTHYFFTRFNWSKTGTQLGVLLGVFVLYMGMRSQILGAGVVGIGEEVTDLLNNPFYGMTFAEKYATILYTLGDYIRLLLIPHPLTHDYYPYHVPIMHWGNWQVLLSLLIYAGLGYLAVRGWQKKWQPAYGIWFYLLTLSIVSNVVINVGTFMNERFLFMPSLGYCLVVGWLIGQKLPKLTRDEFNLLSIGLLAVLFIGYGVRTWTRVPVWEDPLSLNRAAVEVSQNSTRANCFMATALYHEYRRVKQEVGAQEAKPILDTAFTYIEKSLEIHPEYGSAMTMRAGLVGERYSYDRNLEAVLQEFEQILQRKNQLQYIDQFLDYLNNTGADKERLLRFAHEIGYEYFAQKQQNYKYALHYLSKGLQVDPNDSRILLDIGMTYRAMGNEQAAQQYLSRARGGEG